MIGKVSAPRSIRVGPRASWPINVGWCREVMPPLPNRKVGLYLRAGSRLWFIARRPRMSMADHDYPTPKIVDYVLEALNPGTGDPEAKINALFAAMAINREETIGVTFGITNGLLGAIEERTHGLVTAQEIYDDLAAGIRCRMAAAMAEEAANPTRKEP